MAKHDLIFFEKRSTPKVVNSGEKFEGREDYGKQTRRRPATEEEEKIIARGDWLRVDQSGNKGGQEGYKKTRMKGRKHLVEHGFEDDEETSLAHYGVKGMKWGVRKKDSSGASSSSSSEKSSDETKAFKDAADSFYSKKSAAELKAEGKAKLKAQSEQTFPEASPSARQQRRARKADKLDANADKMDQYANELIQKREALKPGVISAFRKASYNQDIAIYEAQRDGLRKEAENVRAGKFTTNEKILIGTGAALAVGALAVYGNQKYTLHKEGINSSVAKRMYEENLKRTQDEWRSIFGEDIEFSQASSSFTAGGAFFYPGLTSKKAFDRPEFTIPEGTIFQRLSNHQEDHSGYGQGTYSTFLSNDKKIYGASGEFGSKKYAIEFQADGPVRVPNLTTLLSSATRVAQRLYPDETHTPETIFASYHKAAGGSWRDSFSQELFTELRSQGYSAIVDDMDAGYLGDLPVVFFGNAKSSTITPRGTGAKTVDGVGLLKVSNKYT